MRYTDRVIDPTTRGLVISKSSLLVVQDGSVDLYEIYFDIKITSTVVISLRSPLEVVSVNPASIRFTPSDCHIPRRVVVSCDSSSAMSDMSHADVVHLLSSSNSFFDLCTFSLSVRLLSQKGFMLFGFGDNSFHSLGLPLSHLRPSLYDKDEDVRANVAKHAADVAESFPSDKLVMQETAPKPQLISTVRRAANRIDPYSVSRPVPIDLGTSTDVVHIAGGFDFSYIVLADGRVLSAGNERYGQLGRESDHAEDDEFNNDTNNAHNNSNTNNNLNNSNNSNNNNNNSASKEVVSKKNYHRSNIFYKPVSIKEFIVQVACGQEHALMLTVNGHVFACGRCDQGQLGLPMNVLMSAGDCNGSGLIDLRRKIQREVFIRQKKKDTQKMLHDISEEAKKTAAILGDRSAVTSKKVSNKKKRQSSSKKDNASHTNSAKLKLHKKTHFSSVIKPKKEVYFFVDSTSIKKEIKLIKDVISLRNVFSKKNIKKKRKRLESFIKKRNFDDESKNENAIVNNSDISSRNNLNNTAINFNDTITSFNSTLTTNNNDDFYFEDDDVNPFHYLQNNKKNKKTKKLTNFAVKRKKKQKQKNKKFENMDSTTADIHLDANDMKWVDHATLSMLRSVGGEAFKMWIDTPILIESLASNFVVKQIACGGSFSACILKPIKSMQANVSSKSLDFTSSTGAGGYVSVWGWKVCMTSKNVHQIVSSSTKQNNDTLSNTALNKSSNDPKQKSEEEEEEEEQRDNRASNTATTIHQDEKSVNDDDDDDEAETEKTMLHVDQPSLIKNMENSQFLRVTCGSSHMLLLSKDGNVLSCGLTARGRLGIGSCIEHQISTPTRVLSLSTCTYIDCGFFHSAAIDVHQKLWMWGENSDGQLGMSTKRFPYLSIPRRVNKVDAFKVTSISLGLNVTTCITDGACYIWGGSYHASASKYIPPVSSKTPPSLTDDQIKLEDSFFSSQANGSHLPSIVVSLMGCKIQKVVACGARVFALGIPHATSSFESLCDNEIFHEWLKNLMKEDRRWSSKLELEENNLFYQKLTKSKSICDNTENGSKTVSSNFDNKLNNRINNDADRFVSARSSKIDELDHQSNKLDDLKLPSLTNHQKSINSVTSNFNMDRLHQENENTSIIHRRRRSSDSQQQNMHEKHLKFDVIMQQSKNKDVSNNSTNLQHAKKQKKSIAFNTSWSFFDDQNWTERTFASTTTQNNYSRYNNSSVSNFASNSDDIHHESSMEAKTEFDNHLLKFNDENKIENEIQPQNLMAASFDLSPYNLLEQVRQKLNLKHNSSIKKNHATKLFPKSDKSAKLTMINDSSKNVVRGAIIRNGLLTSSAASKYTAIHQSHALQDHLLLVLDDIKNNTSNFKENEEKMILYDLLERWECMINGLVEEDAHKILESGWSQFLPKIDEILDFDYMSYFSCKRNELQFAFSNVKNSFHNLLQVNDEENQFYFDQSSKNKKIRSCSLFIPAAAHDHKQLTALSLRVPESISKSCAYKYLSQPFKFITNEKQLRQDASHMDGVRCLSSVSVSPFVTEAQKAIDVFYVNDSDLHELNNEVTTTMLMKNIRNDQKINKSLTTFEEYKKKKNYDAEINTNYYNNTNKMIKEQEKIALEYIKSLKDEYAKSFQNIYDYDSYLTTTHTQNDQHDGMCVTMFGDVFE